MAGELIAVFTKNRTNPAYEAARLGADRAAARLGARASHFVPERPDDVDQQIALVDRAIAQRPDAVVFVPVHVTEMEGAVRRFIASGIPVVNILNRMSGDGFVTFVGSDDYRLAVGIAEALFRHLGGSGDVILLEGTPGALTSGDRVRGFRDAAQRWPRIRIVASRAADYQRETARRVMQELLASVARIDGVLSANDVMSLGAIDALEAAGRSLPVIGVNALPEAIAAIKSGKMLATADFDAMKISCIATEAAIRHLRGEPVPGEIILPVSIVDRANCAPWDTPISDRQCPSWSDIVGNRRPAPPKS
jgi:ribose transport system substrate-binding protein